MLAWSNLEQRDSAKSLDRYFFKFFIYLLLEREEGKGKEREGNTEVQEKHRLVALRMRPTGHLVCNPGMCPDWELNQRPFGSEAVLNPLSHTSQG